MTPARPARAPRRRTQEERSTDTRRRILDAALACLAEHGYAGTTTLAVAARARVSRGAQLHHFPTRSSLVSAKDGAAEARRGSGTHHFPTRSSLVSAAVQHLYHLLREDYERGFAEVPPGADRARAAIGLLWAAFQDERLTAVLELSIAARTDADLARELLPVSEAHHAHVVRLARDFFPEAAGDPEGFQATLDFVLDALQGMAVRRLLRPGDPSIGLSLARLEAMAASALALRSRD